MSARFNSSNGAASRSTPQAEPDWCALSTSGSIRAGPILRQPVNAAFRHDEINSAVGRRSGAFVRSVDDRFLMHVEAGTDQHRHAHARLVGGEDAVVGGFSRRSTIRGRAVPSTCTAAGMRVHQPSCTRQVVVMNWAAWRLAGPRSKTRSASAAMTTCSRGAGGGFGPIKRVAIARARRAKHCENSHL